MGLETGDFIDNLDDNNPLASDPISQGDDHIRLVKHVLKFQFPNLGATIIQPTGGELNFVDGVTAPIQDQINNALTQGAQIANGQMFLCRASAAPSARWTLVGDVEARYPLIRSFYSQALGGTNDNAVGLTVGAIPGHLNTANESGMPAHEHNYNFRGSAGSGEAGGSGLFTGNLVVQATINGTARNAVSPHAHPAPGISSNSSYRPSYLSMVILQFLG